MVTLYQFFCLSYFQLLQSMASVMRECWYVNPHARNHALFYKLKLVELAREDKIDYDTQE
jgi:hypothetical protein